MQEPSLWQSLLQKIQWRKCTPRVALTPPDTFQRFMSPLIHQLLPRPIPYQIFPSLTANPQVFSLLPATAKIFSAKNLPYLRLTLRIFNQLFNHIHVTLLLTFDFFTELFIFRSVFLFFCSFFALFLFFVALFLSPLNSSIQYSPNFKDSRWCFFFKFYQTRSAMFRNVKRIEKIILFDSYEPDSICGPYRLVIQGGALWTKFALAGLGLRWFQDCS